MNWKRTPLQWTLTAVSWLLLAVLVYLALVLLPRTPMTLELLYDESGQIINHSPAPTVYTCVGAGVAVQVIGGLLAVFLPQKVGLTLLPSRTLAMAGITLLCYSTLRPLFGQGVGWVFLGLAALWAVVALCLAGRKWLKS